MDKFVTAGIAGHVDHGKTALVRCLTGIDTDRLQEEKRRGLSIESGIAPLELSSGKRIALVDVPGHTDFLKNTIRGLSSVDMAILIVAADDGVMPQTLEHIQILDFFGAKGGFIVLSKADLVDEETRELAEIEIRELIEGTFFEGKPVIPFSAIDRRGLDDIRINIEKAVEKIPDKDIKSPFRLWIDDQVKGFAGFGTVVSGTILSGTLKQDDPLHLLPSGIETRARSLETHHEKGSEAFAGQRAGINLHRVPLKEIKRGMVLAEPGSVNSSYLLNVDLKILKSAIKPVKNRQRMKLYLGTSVTNTLVVIMEKEQLEPGENGLVQFRLMKPVAALPGDTFVICLLNVQTVIGGGKVLEIPREKYRQARASITIPCLKALQEHNLKEFVEHIFKSNFTRLITANELAGNTGFPVTEIEAEIRARVKTGELLSFKGRGVLQRELYQELKEKLLKIVEKILRQNPLKMSATAQETINQLAPSLDEAPFQKMLAELCNEGKLIKSGGCFKISSLSVKLSDERENLINLLLDYAQESGFVPFSAHTFWKLNKRKTNINDIQRLLDYLHTQKRLIRLNNRRFLSPQVMEQIKERVRQVIKKNGRLTIGDCKEVMGYGRTVGVPVLEYLDSIGFTRRQGNERVLKTD
ncbi:MAG: selenocysteine-specific translation elongation factor [Deltaproteobacteria bacterium]|nr:selenocysteine-specific translation elongation factor [Deltaproteobacteria bacterium]